MIRYRSILEEDLTPSLFSAFIRRQAVTQCWRKRSGVWRIESDPFVDDWNEADHQALIRSLRRTLEGQGAVYGAFDGPLLKGFVSLEGTMLGSRAQYMDLSHLYVSQELRGSGIGRRLFSFAKQFARSRHAEKLYLSAHSAVESQAFYHAMGCVEAEEYDAAHVNADPYDCHLEYRLSYM